jgi:hypothetical protein
MHNGCLLASLISRVIIPLFQFAEIPILILIVHIAHIAHPHSHSHSHSQFLNNIEDPPYINIT